MEPRGATHRPLRRLASGRREIAWSNFAALERAVGSDARISVDYFDTATARQERRTGADLGVIIHGVDAHNAPWIKVARFQVKKAVTPRQADVDLDQLRTLRVDPATAFYLLLNRNAPAAPPPFVTPAPDPEREIERHRAEPGGALSGTMRIHLTDVEDWAFWLSFALADPQSGVGASVTTPLRAVQRLSATPAPPSRIVAFGLGAAANEVDWASVIPLAREDRD